MFTCCMLQASFSIPPLTLLFPPLILVHSNTTLYHTPSCLSISHQLYISLINEGIVGLKDPLREGVVEAIHRMQDSGAKVRGEERR